MTGVAEAVAAVVTNVVVGTVIVVDDLTSAAQSIVSEIMNYPPDGVLGFTLSLLWDPFNKVSRLVCYLLPPNIRFDPIGPTMTTNGLFLLCNPLLAKLGQCTLNKLLPQPKLINNPPHPLVVV